MGAKEETRQGKLQLHIGLYLNNTTISYIRYEYIIYAIIRPGPIFRFNDNAHETYI